MQEFFPTDVRVRVEGEFEDARALIPGTRRLLFLALLLQQRYGDGRPVHITARLSDAALASVFLHEGQKIVTVSASSIAEAPETASIPQIEDLPLIFPGVETLFMLHGWVRRGVVVPPTAPATDDLLDAYFPTAGSARAGNLASSFGLIAKLAIDVQGVKTEAVATPIALFTGTMKKVVSAAYGVGIVDNADPAYVTGTVPSPTKRGIRAYYTTGWDRSQGIYKAADQNHWIVEIGQRGIYAMPLMLFEISKGSGFRAAADAAGDVDTVRVVDEFGGIPTGETIPALDTDLTTAVAAGKVLCLRTAGDMEPYYTGGMSYCTEWSWAFNASGTEAHNTCLRLISKQPGRGTWTGGVPPAAGLGYYLYGEHWKVVLSLSAHDVSKLLLTPPQAIGTGTATLSLVEQGTLPLSGALDFMWVPESGAMRQPLAIARLPAFAESDRNAFATYSNANGNSDTITGLTGITGAAIFVYFDGDKLKRVKWVPGDVLTEAVIAVSGSTKYTKSPPAYVSEDFDNRRVNINGGAVGKIGPNLVAGRYVQPDIGPLDPVGTVTTFNEFVQVYGVREGWASLNFVTRCVSSRYTKWKQEFRWVDRDGFLFYELTFVEGVDLTPQGDASYQSYEDIVYSFDDSAVGFFANGVRVNFTWRPRDKAGVTTWPITGSVFFDGAINPGPSSGYSFTDGPYQTATSKPKPYVIRFGMPNNLEPYLPHETGWVGSV